MSAIAHQLELAYPDSNKGRGVFIEPLPQAITAGLGQVLYPLFGAVGFVLLIACANVANLLIRDKCAELRIVVTAVGPAHVASLGFHTFQLIGRSRPTGGRDELFGRDKGEVCPAEELGWVIAIRTRNNVAAKLWLTSRTRLAHPRAR
jgi:hypothetical protein